MTKSQRPPALLAWSSGKDSALALREVREWKRFEISAIWTTLSQNERRVSMHGTSLELLELQAQALGLPLIKIELPTPCPNTTYEARVHQALRRESVPDLIFGDLFLDDVRDYRIERFEPLGYRCHFPLWKRSTRALARDMFELGIEATVICIDPGRLDESFLGRKFDATFLLDLPPTVDPCGENGEFHTFVTRAPDFAAPIHVRPGQTYEERGFLCLDLQLASESAPSEERDSEMRKL